MQKDTRTHWGLNFNSGPGQLPKAVLQEASQAILDFEGTGLSILEIGHRTPLFEAVLQEARDLVRELMALPARYEVLFLQGGATSQFYQVPLNLLPATGEAAYLDAGTWGTKAIKEAQLYGKVHVLGSSAAQKYTCIPKGWTVPDNATYCHITSNNTIEGTQQHEWPELTGVPLIADMSSDIFSRSLNFEKFGLIYAGAQKNIGAAGTTLVVLDPELLGKADRTMPAMLDYRNHIAAGSMLNTPPVFTIYICMLTLRWLKQQGGVAGVAQVNRQKAAMLYALLDNTPLYKPTVAREDRSDMNVVWVLEQPSLDKMLLDEAHAEGITGIQGHRTAGGFRASLYNAMPLESVETLCSFLTHFANKVG